MSKAAIALIVIAVCFVSYVVASIIGAISIIRMPEDKTKKEITLEVDDLIWLHNYLEQSLEHVTTEGDCEMVNKAVTVLEDITND